MSSINSQEASSSAVPRSAKRLGLTALFIVAIAVLSHLATIWIAPRLIMNRALATLPIGASNQAYFPPPTDASSRQIVMPSPDLLYALCRLDLRSGPVRVQADLRGGSYASVALYAANTDNFAVVNDAKLGGKALNWLLHRPGQRVDASDGVAALVAPSDTVLVLMRVLVADAQGDLARFDALRKTLRCEPLNASPSVSR